MATFTARVRRGAALLDRTKPGWAEEIDLEKLNLGSGTHCVLGQLYLSYRIGCRKLGLSDHVQVESGFYLDFPDWTPNWVDDARYALLTKRWRKYIKGRRVQRAA